MYKIFLEYCGLVTAKRYQHRPGDFVRTLSSPGSNVALQTTKGEETRKLPPTSIVYWLRLGFGALAGVVYNVIGFGQQGVGAGTLGIISVGIGIYAVSVFLVKYVLGYGPTELKGPNKHVSIGLGAYIIWMVFVTILLNTILNPSPR